MDSDRIDDVDASTTVDDRLAMLQFVGELSAAADSMAMQTITNRHVSVCAVYLNGSNVIVQPIRISPSHPTRLHTIDKARSLFVFSG